jgi:hypothetical protein
LQKIILPALQRDAMRYTVFASGVHLWDESLQQQIYLGDDAFIRKMQSQIKPLDPSEHRPANVSKVQLSAPSLDCGIAHFTHLAKAASHKAQRNQIIADAFYQGGHTQTAIAQAFGVSSSTVSRVILAAEKGGSDETRR